ncbi:MAG: adenylate kinase [Bacteroidaceae bacterium]|nr:adenylate kinase [Bacteroidaceae bacterium]
MVNVVIFGAPGSGKGTYSAAIVEKFGFEHISTGSVLRAEIAAGSELGKIAQGYMNQGQLIPDELMIDILAKTYDAKKGSKGVIFDGFPRTIAQAEALQSMFKERGEKITATLNLNVEEAELLRRLLNRATIEGRADDNEETIKKRFDVYNKQTSPLIKWFKDLGVLYDFYYKGSKDVMIGEIIAKLDELCQNQTL